MASPLPRVSASKSGVQTTSSLDQQGLILKIDEISELWRLGAETDLLGERLREFVAGAEELFQQKMRSAAGQKDEVLLPWCARHEEMIHKIEDVLDDFAQGKGAAHWHDMRRAMDRALHHPSEAATEEAGFPSLAVASGTPEPVIAWTESLALGIDWIDRHHQAMIEIVNKIGALPPPYDPDDADALLEQLRRVAWHHFHEEEAHLGPIAPERLAAHVGQHRRLLAELDFLIFDIRARRIDLLGVLRKELCPWLTDHIRSSDRADFHAPR